MAGPWRTSHAIGGEFLHIDRIVKTAEMAAGARAWHARRRSDGDPQAVVQAENAPGFDEGAQRATAAKSRHTCHSRFSLRGSKSSA
jgi:hypothetical protein